MIFSLKNNNDKVIIVLHEIYGVNRFINDVCNYYHDKAYDVYCPDLLNRDIPFDYSKKEEAYRYFIDHIGFDVFDQVNILIEQLKKKYKKVMLLGFSIGATIAWRCTSSVFCDGVIGYYGSRIREYLSITPQCPTLLIFAKEDSFDVNNVVEALQYKENVTIEILDGKHGFLDSDSENYNCISTEKALILTEKFLSEIERSV